MEKGSLAHCGMVPTALDNGLWFGKKSIYNSMLHCIRIMRSRRQYLRLLCRAKPLFRMKKRHIDNVVSRYQTPVKTGVTTHLGVTQE
jgi:hypothetical protein